MIKILEGMLILGNVPNFIYKFAMPLNLDLKDNP